MPVQPRHRPGPADHPMPAMLVPYGSDHPRNSRRAGKARCRADRHQFVSQDCLVNPGHVVKTRHGKRRPGSSLAPT